ncbi:MAG: carboxylating nicotinate-nucleotide diphosphorylase [Kiritimatiellae bacterium]|nr:carboxylating nicotinate-nucleotide diphosphorylase [Kiritimatiellia bacterium]
MTTLPDIAADPRLARAIALALEEDVGSGDVTTDSLVDPSAVATGEILSRADCRVSGGPVATAVMKAVSPDMEFETVVADGVDVPAGGAIIRFRGPARAILVAERTALNFMQRMCGIATLTRAFTRVVEDLGTLILDTRKTTPGLRFLEKYAVLCGGGTNHRFGLFDRVLMKDNHRRLWAGHNPGRLDLAVLEARRLHPDVMVEIEVENLEELRSALDGRPEWIMLDNMAPAMMREAVSITRSSGAATRLEASGGITLANVREVAETGVDAISLGCLTHSAPSIDLSLEWSV